MKENEYKYNQDLLENGKYWQLPFFPNIVLYYKVPQLKRVVLMHKNSDQWKVIEIPDTDLYICENSIYFACSEKHGVMTNNYSFKKFKIFIEYKIILDTYFLPFTKIKQNPK